MLKNGEFDGLITAWFDNGQKESESTFINGKKEGLVTDWNRDGSKYIESNYKNGQRHGLYIDWWWTATGEPQSKYKSYEVNFKNGELDGTCIRYWPKGLRWMYAEIIDGRIDNCRYWHEDGEEVECGKRVGINSFMPTR